MPLNVGQSASTASGFGMEALFSTACSDACEQTSAFPGTITHNRNQRYGLICTD